MTAYSIVQRARGLADLQSTDFISYNDTLNSLNESYRDIYASITESNDDYFLQETVVPIDPSNLIVDGNNWEYEIPLPSDFYKLRYIDFRYNGNWQPVNKFNLGAKDINPGNPQYRFRGQKLWIIGSFTTSGSTLRIGYYPPAEFISVPDNAKTYLSTFPAYDGPLISSPVYVDTAQNYLYINAPGTNYTIKAESKTTGVTSTLYTVATVISNLVYYKGYIYFLNSTGNIMRGTTNLTGTSTPASITSSNDITSFTIYNDLIYFTTASATKTCTLSGSGAVQIAVTVQSSYTFLGTYKVYVTAGALYVNDVSILTGVTSVSSDSVYLYVYKTDKTLVKLEISMAIPATPSITNTWVLDTSLSAVGPVSSLFIPIIQDQTKFKAISSAHDTDLAYPLNIVPEMISYQSAIDFRRKQNADPSLLMLRLKELNVTFQESIIRDSYQVERIKNYTSGSGSIFQYSS